jgi:serine/threonine-protein kinase ATR
VPSLLTVLARLIDGREDEVTPPVRRKTYDVLAQAIRHHEHGAEEGMNHAANMILRGMADKDRSVRLSAGYGTNFN